MKRNSVQRSICLIAVVSMMIGLAACGSGKGGHGVTISSSADNTEISGGLGGDASVNTVVPAADGTSGNIFADSVGDDTEPYVGELTEITIALPTRDLHTKYNSLYERLVAEIEEYTGFKVNWQWYDTATYYEQIEQDIQAGTVADIVLIDRSEVFLNAAEEGVFWELGPYIDGYDNLATMSETHRRRGSYCGKMYGIPYNTIIADDGLTYRVDWLEKLGLKEPTDWESFCEMLYAFTYDDPDGNGVDDTVGLVLDPNTSYWDVMESWFGVPNSWGIDENGDLIHKSQTIQYQTAYGAFRELYAEGLINNGSNGITDFRQLQGQSEIGMDSLAIEYRNLRGGSTVNSFSRICAIWSKMVENDGFTGEEQIFALQSAVDTGYGTLNYTAEHNGEIEMLAISSTRIKNEEQLRQALQFINDICDEKISYQMTLGLEGVHYNLDENGYVVGILGPANFYELTTYNLGINKLPRGYVAEANKIFLKFQDTALHKKSAQLQEENADKCAINHAYQFMNKEELQKVRKLEAQLFETEIKYITGEIDEAGFKAALAEWMANGGEAMTREVNKKYHGAGY